MLPQLTNNLNFPQTRLGRIVLLFQESDDHIVAINHMMYLLTAVSLPGLYSRSRVEVTSGKQRTVILVQLHGEANGQFYFEEELAFLAGSCIAEGQPHRTISYSHYCLSSMILDAYDSDCDETQHYQVALFGKFISLWFDARRWGTQIHLLLLKCDFKKEELGIDREIALENKIKQLENIVFKRDQSTQTVHMLMKPQFFYDHTTKQALGFQNPFYLKKTQQLEPKLYDGNVIKNTSVIVIPDSEKTLILAEESRILVNYQIPLFIVDPTNVEVPKELLIINKDIVNIIMNSSVDNASVNVHECEKCLKLETELLNKSENMNENKIKKDLEEIETINIELDHRVSKLIDENAHLKQTYKQLYDSIKPARIRSKEQCDDLINQVNLKSVEISDLNASLQEKDLVITALKDELSNLRNALVILVVCKK
ncbi:hypothetical protein Tco_1515802 [Tanacetum coccineum]